MVSGKKFDNKVMAPLSPGRLSQLAQEHPPNSPRSPSEGRRSPSPHVKVISLVDELAKRANGATDDGGTRQQSTTTEDSAAPAPRDATPAREGKAPPKTPPKAPPKVVLKPGPRSESPKREEHRFLRSTPVAKLQPPKAGRQGGGKEGKGGGRKKSKKKKKLFGQGRGKPSGREPQGARPVDNSQLG